MFTPYLQGVGMGFGLIAAIGAQNAFVLSQGVRRNHHLTVALICSLCDVALISLGVTGVGSALAGNPTWRAAAAWGGAVFLGWHGLGALRRALGSRRLEADREAGRSVKAVCLATLAVTLLNPHVYLDTVLLLGGISSRYEGAGPYYFGLGAASASFAWFFSLGLGGRLLAPVFRDPRSWRVLDGLVCLVMWGLSVSLLTQAV
ncbi:MAG: LysE/ArgO family amino acid transporter [Pseudomonadota bacterium]